MNRRRLSALLVGHALSDGVPIGPVLRESRGPGATGAAAHVDAGRLVEGLTQAEFPADLVALGVAWPQAMRGAQRRITALPAGRVLAAPLIQTLLYGMLIATAQGITMAQLDRVALPALQAVGFLSPGADLPLLTLARVAIPVLLFVFPLAILVCVWAPRWLPVVGGHLRTARRRAIAAAVAESSAPALVRATLDVPAGTPQELDAATASHVAGAEVAMARLVAVARLAVFGAVTGVAGVITFAIYRFVGLLVA